MNQILEQIYKIGIIPVIAIDDPDKAVPLAKALVKGGLPAAEITFRTQAAEASIRAICKEVPEMLVGVRLRPASSWTVRWQREQNSSSALASIRIWSNTASPRGL